MRCRERLAMNTQPVLSRAGTWLSDSLRWWAGCEENILCGISQLYASCMHRDGLWEEFYFAAYYCCNWWAMEPNGAGRMKGTDEKKLCTAQVIGWGAKVSCTCYLFLKNTRIRREEGDGGWVGWRRLDRRNDSSCKTDIFSWGHGLKIHPNLSHARKPISLGNIISFSVLWPMPDLDEWPSALTLLLHLAHFWTRGSCERVQQPVTGRARHRGRAREREREIQSPAAKSDRWKGCPIARSDRWQDYHLTRSAASRLSDGILEVWIEVQISTSMSSLPTDPPGCGHFPHSVLSRPWSQGQKQSNQSPEDTRTRPSLHFQHLFRPFYCVFFLSAVMPYPCSFLYSSFSSTLLITWVLSPLSLSPFSISPLNKTTTTISSNMKWIPFHK